MTCCKPHLELGTRPGGRCPARQQPARRPAASRQQTRRQQQRRQSKCKSVRLERGCPPQDPGSGSFAASSMAGCCHACLPLVHQCCTNPAYPARPTRLHLCPPAGAPWMFPWERRQLQGGALRWWEKVYWGVFVVGISLILFNRLEWEKGPDPVSGGAARPAAAHGPVVAMARLGRHAGGLCVCVCVCVHTLRCLACYRMASLLPASSTPPGSLARTSPCLAHGAPPLLLPPHRRRRSASGCSRRSGWRRRAWCWRGRASWCGGAMTTPLGTCRQR